MTVYHSVVQNYIRFTAPVFYMRQNMRLGEEFGLHFFEPRYRLLIAEVMENWPSAIRGEPIVADKYGNFPSFIYVNYNSVAPSSRAFIVHVRQCYIHPGGRADVLLMPVAHVQLEHIWDRPNSGRLYMARAVRLGKAESQRTEDAFNRRFVTSRSALHMPEEWISSQSEILRGGLASIITYLVAGQGHINVTEENENSGGE